MKKIFALGLVLLSTSVLAGPYQFCLNGRLSDITGQKTFTTFQCNVEQGFKFSTPHTLFQCVFAATGPKELFSTSAGFGTNGPIGWTDYDLYHQDFIGSYFLKGMNLPGVRKSTPIRIFFKDKDVWMQDDYSVIETTSAIHKLFVNLTPGFCSSRRRY